MDSVSQQTWSSQLPNMFAILFAAVETSKEFADAEKGSAPLSASDNLRTKNPARRWLSASHQLPLSCCRQFAINPGNHVYSSLMCRERAQSFTNTTNTQSPEHERSFCHNCPNTRHKPYRNHNQPSRQTRIIGTSFSYGSTYVKMNSAIVIINPMPVSSSD